MMEQYLDYGWRQNGGKVLLLGDKSLLLGESAHLTQLALSQMSEEFYYAERCMQCGICTDSCPYSNFDGNNFSPREFIQEARLGLLDLSVNNLWWCTGCGSCERKCPFGIKTTNVIHGLRKVVFEEGVGFIPDSLKNSAASMVSYKNPWKEDQKKRWGVFNITETSRWSIVEDNKHLLFGCCFNSFDSYGKNSAKKTVDILLNAGIEIDYLYDSEVCCGDSVLRVGDQSGFDILRNDNQKAIATKGIKSIIAISPHCYDTMKNEYFKRNGKYALQPLITFLHSLLLSGKLIMKNRIDKRVTFHDSCFLCRHHNIYNEPRDIINSISGIDFVEMKHNGHASICCGGGGCGAWMDWRKSERLSNLRLYEALDIDAEIIITACPLCHNMISSNTLSDSRFQHIVVKDIAELIYEASDVQNNMSF